MKTISRQKIIMIGLKAIVNTVYLALISIFILDGIDFYDSLTYCGFALLVIGLFRSTGGKRVLPAFSNVGTSTSSGAANNIGGRMMANIEVEKAEQSLGKTRVQNRIPSHIIIEILFKRSYLEDIVYGGIVFLIGCIKYFPYLMNL